VTDRNIRNMAASVHQRLLNAARQAGRPFNELLQYYAIERFLFRLSKSSYAERLVLKGALTLLVWRTPLTRPTRDIDLLGKIDNDPDKVRAVIAGICEQRVDPDGLLFESAGVTTERIAEDADYHGVRAKFRGYLGNARIPMQIDIGFRDVITPGPVGISYPAVLDHAPAQLHAYNRQTVVAEKFEAMVKLGILNSRMKDFFDVWLLAQNFDFEGGALADAINNTFAQRGSRIPGDPVCFSREFAADTSKTAQWSAFLRNGRLDHAPAQFAQAVESVRQFLQPLAVTLATGGTFAAHWPPGSMARCLRHGACGSRSTDSHWRSNCMNTGFGRTIGRFLCTNSRASSRDRRSRHMKYATTTMPLRSIPASQCTKTVRPARRCVSMNCTRSCSQGIVGTDPDCSGSHSEISTQYASRIGVRLNTARVSGGGRRQ